MVKRKFSDRGNLWTAGDRGLLDRVPIQKCSLNIANKLLRNSMFERTYFHTIRPILGTYCIRYFKFLSTYYYWCRGLPPAMAIGIQSDTTMVLSLVRSQ